MSEILRKRARSYAYKTFLLAVDRLRLAERGKQPIDGALKEVNLRLAEFMAAHDSVSPLTTTGAGPVESPDG